MNNIEMAQEAALNLHNYFQGIFYTLITFFVVLSVIVELFKLPLGTHINTTKVVGRALIATLLLACYPSIANFLASISNTMAKEIGGFENIELVKDEMAKRLEQINWSWISIRNNLFYVLSFALFSILHFSVYFCEILLLYVWLFCFVLSPLLISFFVFESTAGATLALFRTLIEASFWKILWSVCSALLWSTANFQLEQASNSEFIEIIGLVLCLSISMILTPVLTNILVGRGLAGAASMVQNMALPSPQNYFNKGARSAITAPQRSADNFRNFYQNRALSKINAEKYSEIKFHQSKNQNKGGPKTTGK